MTNTTRIRYITASLAVAGTILAIGDKLTGIPGLPAWLIAAWPMVYGAAITFDRVAHIIWPDVPTSPVQVNPAQPSAFDGQKVKP